MIFRPFFLAKGRICCAAKRFSQIADTVCTAFYQTPIALLHTALRIKIRNINISVTCLFYVFIYDLICRTPLGCLIFARQNQLQFYVRIPLAQFQNGLCSQRVKTQSTACHKINDAVFDQVCNFRFQTFINFQVLLRRNLPMACKTTCLRFHSNLSYSDLYSIYESIFSIQ